MTPLSFVGGIKFALAWAFLVAALITYLIHPVNSSAVVLGIISIAFAVVPTTWR